MQVLSPSPSLDREQDDCEHQQHQQHQHQHQHPDFPHVAAEAQQQMPIEPSRLEGGAVADNKTMAAGLSYLWSYEEEQMAEEQMAEGFYDDVYQYHVQYHYPYSHPEAYAERVGLYGAMGDPQMPQVGG